MKTQLMGSLGALATAGQQPAGNDVAETSADTLLQHYQACLGGPFPKATPLQPQRRETIRKEGYRIESITYEVEPQERVPALLLIPDSATAQHPAPGIAVWHQHNGEYHLGKSEPAGLAGNPMHHTAVALVREGYVVLCPDALCFEERQDPTGKLKKGDYERFEFLREVVRGRSLAWKNVLEMRRAVDYLSSRPEVRAGELGCYGHSMGSTHSWLVGPLEPRLKCIVGNCCLPSYEAIEHEHLLHCFPNFVPGWGQFGDTPDIAALIAPRALHLNFGAQDTGSPIGFVRASLPRIAAAYQKAGATENFTSFIEEGQGHVLTEAMWQRVKETFARHLKRS
ncbi:dienelactone hydrolase family protein [Larkinella insperata]|uniref:Dienelactone hydrolase family protein n=1 Tax=Larkinella insperata TaxID=332158 RepID=A0ABW3QB50_9BACT|nr:dienelactone hydrolase family protein [Larkinella insperata]